ncbi:MAG: polysaccharide deacetylase family protein [Gemmatimonadota bacterium]|nr:polysaccharide deacetylase family protein [Gemmatimonadota bacterium]
MKAILTYHSIDPSGSPISVDVGSFRRHVQWLAGGRVQVVSVDELLALPADADAVALTFDDGFENFGRIAAPMLLEKGLPATLFVVSDHVGGTNAWGGRADSRIPMLPLLDWPALGALAEAGIALGAHSRTHPRLSRLEGAALEEEVVGCGERIRSETGCAPSGFAYPYGDLHPASAALVMRAYDWGCTTELRALGAGLGVEVGGEMEVDGGCARARLPRLDAYYLKPEGRLEGWGSPAFRRHLWLRSHARSVRVRLTAGLRRL